MTDERVVVWAPGRDGQLTCGFLSERGFECQLAHTWADVRLALAGDLGCLLVGGELLTPDVVFDLADLLAAQPPWSDLPVLVIGAREDDPTQPHALHAIANVSLLPRPLTLPTLVTGVLAALRARRRQYQVRDLLMQRDEADRRKDEFLAMLAHELRNPLAPLRTGLQVLRLGPSSDVVDRMHHLMERQLGHVTRLVDDLLDVSRLTRGVVALKLRPIDLRDAVHQACDSAAGVAGEKGLTLQRHLPDTPVMVQADPVRLEQMIGNLLANATRFTPPGGRIDVSAEQGEGTGILRVRDTGEGIPPDQVERVFDLFAQTEREMDRSQGGLGIGLTVVRSLATLHGGTATLSSEGLGRGAEATIALPLLEETHAQATWPPPPRAVDAVAPLRVVIIEDNPDAAEALAVYLERLGHDVAIARDGRAGLDAVARHRPHVVICDIGLPELDGYEVARRLLSAEEGRNCLLIAVTGYGDVVDRARTRAAGFTHHLTKPADPAELVRLLADADRVRCA